MIEIVDGGYPIDLLWGTVGGFGVFSVYKKQENNNEKIIILKSDSFDVHMKKELKEESEDWKKEFGGSFF